MSRLPVRLRLTLAFAGLMALVLAAVGAFLYLRLEADLNESIETGLRSRAGDAVALLGGDGSLSGSRAALIESEESFAQVLSPEGEVLDSTGQLGSDPVLAPAAVEEALGGAAFFERDGLRGVEGSARLLAVPAEGGGVVVVGSSLEDRDEALSSLLSLLLLGGPAALLLASAAAWWLASAALRPVEEMRRRAAEISAAAPGERLPVPDARDELRRLGVTLNEMLGRLEEALRRERRFVDDASHELRTPLALHRAELEVALEYERGEEALRRAIGSAIEEVDTLIALAEDLLVLARAGEPGGREPVPVQPLLEDVAGELSGVAGRAGRRISVAAADPPRAEGDTGRREPLRVRGDARRLRRAVANLAENALRHGGGEVRLSARREDGVVAIHVTDRGPGFPDEFLPRAFERFSRGDAARAGDGAGLGLAIAAAVAEAHGGAARAANRAGGGADVWLELPAA